MNFLYKKFNYFMRNNFMWILIAAIDALEQFDIFIFIINHLNVNIAAIFIIFLFVFLIKDHHFTSNLIKIIFNFVKITIKNNITKIYFDYTRFLPFFYILFFFVLISNLGGLIPFVYTITSLALVPFFFSLINFIFVSIFIVSGYRTLSLAGFFPAGTNIYIAPLLVLIEIISYFVKLFSLAVRLFANMFAGHVLVKVLLSLAWIISLQVCVFSTSVFFLLFLIVCVMGLELFICGLQAFVFTNLASVYLDQGVNFIAH